MAFYHVFCSVFISDSYRSHSSVSPINQTGCTLLSRGEISALFRPLSPLSAVKTTSSLLFSSLPFVRNREAEKANLNHTTYLHFANIIMNVPSFTFNFKSTVVSVYKSIKKCQLINTDILVFSVNIKQQTKVVYRDT